MFKKFIYLIALIAVMMSVAVPAVAMVLPGSVGTVYLTNVSKPPCPGLGTSGAQVLHKGNCVILADVDCGWTSMCFCDVEVLEVISGDDCWEVGLSGAWQRVPGI